MKIVKHTPGFADDLRVPREIVEFQTLAELLDIDYVVKSTTLEGFVKLSRAELHLVNVQEAHRPLEDEYYFHLMAEVDEGYSWWVLGMVYGTMPELATLTLPNWQGKYKVFGLKPEPVTRVVPEISLDKLVDSGAVSFVTRAAELPQYQQPAEGDWIERSEEAKFDRIALMGMGNVPARDLRSNKIAVDHKDVPVGTFTGKKAADAAYLFIKSQQYTQTQFDALYMVTPTDEFQLRIENTDNGYRLQLTDTNMDILIQPE